jgi:hypothetical protein
MTAGVLTVIPLLILDFKLELGVTNPPQVYSTLNFFSLRIGGRGASESHSSKLMTWTTKYLTHIFELSI